MLLAAAGCSGEAGLPQNTDQNGPIQPGQIDIVDGVVYYEGDIVLGTVDEFGDGRRLQGVGKTNVSEGFSPGVAWPNGLVRWRFDGLTQAELDATTQDEKWRQAVAEWSNVSTIRFEQIPEPPTGNYITVKWSDSTACDSQVGMVTTTNEQVLNIGRVNSAGDDSCPVGSVMHEIGHALGLFHENTRPDRGLFVDQAGVSGTAWDILGDGTFSLLSDYDLESIMHLGDDQAASAGGSLSYAGTSTPVTRQRLSPSFYDIQSVQIMYADQLSPLTSVDHRFSSNKHDVFYRTTTGTVGHQYLYTNRWKTGSDRGSPNSAPIRGTPVSVSRDGTTIDIMVLGDDRRMYHQQYDGGWSGWTRIGGSNDRFMGQPDAVSRSSNRINLFVRGEDRSLKHAYYNGSSWSSWRNLGNQIIGTPTVEAIDGNHLDVFVVGLDHDVWRKSWASNSGWGDWVSMGGIVRGRVTSLKDGDRIHLFVKGTDGKAFHKAYYPLTGETSNPSWQPITNFSLVGNPIPAHSLSGDVSVLVTSTADRTTHMANFSGDKPGQLTWTSLGKNAVGSHIGVDDQLEQRFHVIRRAATNKLRRRTYIQDLQGTWQSWSNLNATVSW